MKGTVAAVLPLLAMLIVPAPLSAKWETGKLGIRGASLATPIEITDPNIVRNFNIWNGPGVCINGKPVYMDPNQQAGAFIDWPKGVVPERPKGLRRYEVSFYVKPSSERPGYVVVFHPALQARSPSGE